MKKLLQNNFLIAFLFLLAYLATSPYIYGWDDQHLEIPILKHLIDPSLYKGDYYVESATKYFTCWLYPILAKIITVKQIPATYFALFLISRYLMFYFIYRLWLLIGGSIFTAVCATAMFLLLGRTDEFLYRSFCHEEFAFIFMFSGFYYFYRERFLLAGLLWGLEVNIHAIYSLFPMLYMLTFILFCHPKRWKLIFQTSTIFVIAALPFLCWQIPISIAREIAHPVPAQEWIPLYLLACPQNFLFNDSSLKDVLSNIHVWWDKMGPYLFLMGLNIFQLVVNPSFRRDKKTQAIIGLSWALLGMVFFFDYIDPKRFVLDLNLVRVAQYLRFFIMGYTTLWACEQVLNSKPWLGLTAAVLILACGTNSLIGLFFLGLVILIFTIDAMLKQTDKCGRIKGGIILGATGSVALALILELVHNDQVPVFWNRHYIVLAVTVIVFLVLLFKPTHIWLRRALLIIPLLGSFIVCMYFISEYLDLKATGPGAWQMLRDWENMQLYVKDHTPKDALILTPYDVPIGGFRIHSDRKPLVCYRDCGIIGFDYAAAKEWSQRINDIKTFKMYISPDDRLDEAVFMAITKYHVDYIVFMKYYGPQGDTFKFKKIYENTVFSFYKVL